MNIINMSFHDSPPNEKVDVAQDEFVEARRKTRGSTEHHRHHDRPEEIERIGVIAPNTQGTTTDSFKHLDENKILRKVRVPDMHPIIIDIPPAHDATDGPPPHPRAGAALFTVLSRPQVQPLTFYPGLQFPVHL